MNRKYSKIIKYRHIQRFKFDVFEILKLTYFNVVVLVCRSFSIKNGKAKKYFWHAYKFIKRVNFSFFLRLFRSSSVPFSLIYTNIEPYIF